MRRLNDVLLLMHWRLWFVVPQPMEGGLLLQGAALRLCPCLEEEGALLGSARCSKQGYSLYLGPPGNTGVRCEGAYIGSNNTVRLFKTIMQRGITAHRYRNIGDSVPH